MTFQEMGLREEILRAIEEINYTDPTPIQTQAIPKVLEGRDLMCCAQTGTGKTAAFALPILQRLSERPKAPLRALVLVPTRELAIQVGQSFRDYGRYLDLITTTVFGGVPIEPQEKMLRHGVDVLVATPGRLIDHTWRGNIDYRNTEFLVLDEADRMLDMGFIKDVREIVGMVREERQSMLFSATLEKEIQLLSRDMLTDPLRIEVAPAAKTLDEVQQLLVAVERGRKRSTLEGLIRDHQMKRAIVFVRTKSGATTLSRQLRERGLRASAMHGDRSQSERVRTLEDFRAGRVHLLVATDIAARGIDIDDVSHVINYDLPYSAGDYVHRIGRTARAGRKGVAISLVTSEDASGLDAIERLISRKIEWVGEPMQRSVEESSAGSGRSGQRRRRSGSASGSRSNGRVHRSESADAAPRTQGRGQAANPAVPRRREETPSPTRGREEGAGLSRPRRADQGSGARRDGAHRRQDPVPPTRSAGHRERRQPEPVAARVAHERSVSPPRTAEKKSGIIHNMMGRLRSRLLSAPAQPVTE
jgi:ATP-dependent RNA helicase RhlE